MFTSDIIEPAVGADHDRQDRVLERIADFGWRLNGAVAPYLILMVVGAACVQMVKSGIWVGVLPPVLLLTGSASRRRRHTRGSAAQVTAVGAAKNDPSSGYGQNLRSDGE